MEKFNVKLGKTYLEGFVEDPEDTQWMDWYFDNEVKFEETKRDFIERSEAIAMTYLIAAFKNDKDALEVWNQLYSMNYRLVIVGWGDKGFEVFLYQYPEELSEDEIMEHGGMPEYYAKKFFKDDESLYRDLGDSLRSILTQITNTVEIEEDRGFLHISYLSKESSPAEVISLKTSMEVTRSHDLSQYYVRGIHVLTKDKDDGRDIKFFVPPQDIIRLYVKFE